MSDFNEWPPSVQDVKNFLSIKDSDVDGQLLMISEFGKAFVERWTKRLFASEERVYVETGNGTVRMYLPDWPITAVGSVYGPCFDIPRHFVTDGNSVSADELVDSDDYRIGGNPRDGESIDHLQLIGVSASGLSSSNWGLGQFEITATTGYTEIPNDLYMATIAAIAEYWQMFKQGKLGVTSKATDASSMGYEVTRNLDLHTSSILNRYKRVMV